MDATVYLRAIFALVFVLGLIGLSGVLYRRYVIDRNIIKGGQKRRLAISEQLYLDSKRRLVLVKKDDTEFLILLGTNGETIVNAESMAHLDPKPSTSMRLKSSAKTSWKRKKT